MARLVADLHLEPVGGWLNRLDIAHADQESGGLPRLPPSWSPSLNPALLDLGLTVGREGLRDEQRCGERVLRTSFPSAAFRSRRYTHPTAAVPQSRVPRRQFRLIPEIMQHSA